MGIITLLNKLKAYTTFVIPCIIFLSTVSCEEKNYIPSKNNDQSIQNGQSTDNDHPADDDQQSNKPPTDSTIGSDAEILTASESNTIILENVKNKRYIIKSGTYSGIKLTNIENTIIEGLNNVRIINTAKRNELVGIIIENSDGLTIKGLSIEDYKQPAIVIKTSANNLTLENLNIKNIANYGIRFEINNKYDGTPKSYSKNIRLINIKAENIEESVFKSEGDIKDDGFYGLIKDFKMTNCMVSNAPILNGLTSLGCAENYEMSNNTVNNVNTNINTHTAIFFAQGNGKIFNNKITNYQGSVVRAWLYSIDKPAAVVEIYNNIAYNSRRYGAFEIQVPPGREKLRSFKPSNAKIYNNTVGRLNTGEPKYFEGRLLDLYQTYGNVEIYNNLIFDLRDSILLNNMSNPKETIITRESNNYYFKTASSAVIDLNQFQSKISEVGANLNISSF